MPSASPLRCASANSTRVSQSRNAPIKLGELSKKRCHEEPPELFAKAGPASAHQAHVLRGTFVTCVTGERPKESWIGDRTGHKSSTMIARYKRNARTFDELNLGTLARLDHAIPELLEAIAPGLPTAHDFEAESSVSSGTSTERAMGFEPTTSCLGSRCSTAELCPHERRHR